MGSTSTITRKALTTITALLLLVIVVSCGQEEAKVASSLVTEEGTVPYYTDLAEAMESAADGQHIAIDFYTDW